MTALDGTLLSAQDGVHHLLRRTGNCRRAVGGDLEGVVVDGGPVRVLTLYQHHADRRGCHRHTEHDVHGPSTLFAGWPFPAIDCYQA